MAREPGRPCGSLTRLLARRYRIPRWRRCYAKFLHEKALYIGDVACLHGPRSEDGDIGHDAHRREDRDQHHEHALDQLVVPELDAGSDQGSEAWSRGPRERTALDSTSPDRLFRVIEMNTPKGDPGDAHSSNARMKAVADACRELRRAFGADQGAARRPRPSRGEP